ncbi:MarR family winged helix-turn-helix transcriptional regulator [Geodermatophilus sabuli]|uniref:DNA-binding transcriptional regulator, MarR family n=1 Tax=Geodermatophilus sabuli TaxID=1564158 RepID=A0A285EKP5_9ACTN|nr:MarR family transcriptional regulator [Geodermatophilus sabuli]MBB3083923.1 DNA-binding MarR family transcriptional regulator [Geodermatophilus sabuli]SNX98571.1 DNA-binding transcriptional regulator, MarR family [Geodermatophilus sabuli]
MGPDGPGSPASHVDLLRRAASGLTSRLEEILGADDLTLDQWRVLRTLTEQGPLSMSDLSALTHVTGPTLTRIVDRLVERALLYRNVDAADRRRVLVHAAERGSALCRSLAPRVADAERDGLAPLSDAEARTLRRLLERLATG